MYAPKRSKFRKHQKGIAKAIESNNSQIHFGKYAIKSLANGRLRSSTVEAVRRAITRKLKRNGQVWICAYPDLSVTAKPLEVRMGKGKGSFEYWACRIKNGQILYEIDGVSDTLARQAAAIAKSKLPMATKFIKKD